ncbi:hypothetical protein [Tateyamaria sp. syn59]|uniref:hypothetical protein n=1 Tax=Tateyamaria sp. syn59 TaxID=2576942 RepID=UPI0011BF3680|nr:hypothetical protein [Tateyamaria sp. syn59]
MTALLKLIGAAHLEVGKAKGTGLGAVMLFLLGAGLLSVVALGLLHGSDEPLKPLIGLMKSWLG